MRGTLVSFLSINACWIEERAKKAEREREGGGVMCHPTQGLFPLEGGWEGGREKKSG